MNQRRENDARLIWTLYEQACLDTDAGNKIYAWKYIPAKEGFIEAVSTVFALHHKELIDSLRDKYGIHDC